MTLDGLFPGVTLHIRPIESSGHAAAEALVGEILGAHLAHYPDGAPYAEGHQSTPISVSHGAGMAVLAIGEPGMAIGVDIESDGRQAQLERVAGRFVGENDNRALSLLELWTAKEAIYKARRQPGLALTEITVGDDEGATVVWHPLPGAMLALAVQRSMLNVE